MADILLDTQSSPVTPAAGQAVFYVDSIAKDLKLRDDSGFTRGNAYNFSVAAQTPAAATRTYIVGSAIQIPSAKLQIGTCFRWRFNMTKTAAGVAASTFDIAVGTAGSTADTARCSFTKPAGTAVVDEAWVEIFAICRGPLSASGVFAAEFVLTHNLAATGHATTASVVVSTISAGFDITAANLIVGLCITSGVADAITIQVIQAEAWNL